MRIAFIQNGLLPYSLEVANALSDAHEVALFQLENTNSIKLSHGPSDLHQVLRMLAHQGVEVYCMNAPRRRNPRNCVTIWTLLRALREWNPDVIHLQDEGDYRIASIVRLIHCPIVVTVHDPVPHLGDSPRAAHRLIQSYLRCLASAIVVHGEKMRRLLFLRNSELSGRIEVIPHGLYTFYRRWIDDRIDEEPNTILFFGRICPYKGLQTLVDAAPKIMAEIRDCHFIIAGEGELDSYCRTKMTSTPFEISNYRIPDDQVACYFQRATLVALPYTEGTQSGILALAYAFRKPVISTQVGSIAEIVEDNVTGIVVPPEDPVAFAQACTRLLQDVQLRNQMRKNIQTKTSNELSWGNIVQELERVYEKAITSHN